MIQISVLEAQPGRKLAKKVIGRDGIVLLEAGMTLSERFIKRLIQFGIFTIHVEDSETLDIVSDDLVRDETRQEAVIAVQHGIRAYTDPSIRATPYLGLGLQDVYKNILDDLMSRPSVLVNLSNTSFTADEYRYHHSVNVAVLSGLIGMAIGLNRNQLIDLGVGALLFDVGMAQLPDDLVNKTGPLTPDEQELARRHAEIGFNILRNQSNISLLSAHCAFQHQERHDGSGYPRGITGDEMHLYAKIVAIADVYDAMTSPRPYRPNYSPGEAIEFLMASGNRYFDLKLIETFVRRVAIYPVATVVQLNTGEVGVVSKVDPDVIQRPIVRITKDPYGNPIKSPFEVDLRRQLNLTITKVL